MKLRGCFSGQFKDCDCSTMSYYRNMMTNGTTHCCVSLDGRYLMFQQIENKMCSTQCNRYSLQ